MRRRPGPARSPGSARRSHASGSIGPGLLSVPRRRVLLGAKATVAAAVGILGGLLFALVSFAGATLLPGGLVLVALVFAHFLPSTWQLRFGSILLPNLTPQLAGDTTPTSCRRPARPQ